MGYSGKNTMQRMICSYGEGKRIPLYIVKADPGGRKPGTLPGSDSRRPSLHLPDPEIDEVRNDHCKKVRNRLRPDNPHHSEQRIQQKQQRDIEHQLSNDRQEKRFPAPPDRLGKMHHTETQKHQRGRKASRPQELRTETYRIRVPDKCLYDIRSKHIVQEHTDPLPKRKTASMRSRFPEE